MAPDFCQDAKAKTETAIVNLSVFDQAVGGALIVQAEALASREISRRFGQDSAISNVEITVLGDFNGEIAPILTAVVSRAQWLENPAVSTWSTRYDAAYQLFQRHGDQETREEIIAGIPMRSTVNRRGISNRNQGASSSRKPTGRLAPWQVHEAYDSGRLTGPEIQRYLDDLD